MNIRRFEFAPGKYEGRYWDNGYGCAIVACVTEGIDWAAYIGGAPGYDAQEDLEYVADFGSKLREKDARYFFPEIDLPYRDYGGSTLPVSDTSGG